ncbi:hypothetical protein SR42_15360 [Clostridium botulinum]|uniref:hypothetical protein n=1 Tax=Clostridium botulinum TaxID=1491 RepID=UPI000596AF8F|nr:hypothetical protein [Clostridium botulinum]KIL06940.1 hypothetical protein SR42_15360 [Clostridium botulinum]MBY6935253.1 hypothetical protein [Clostridium botulinum]MBY6948389.1 hypothetical protein [Clostridium botulinum]MBY7021398.1 hypothetical protein [Clostridium botulinum]NFH81797.1 hypothetical protein [Clostridium botulinum]
MQATGDNFLLTFIKDNVAYPVALNKEQRQAFNVLMNLIPGQINIVNEPIGQVMTVKELKERKEGKN